MYLATGDKNIPVPGNVKIEELSGPHKFYHKKENGEAASVSFWLTSGKENLEVVEKHKRVLEKWINKNG